MLVCAIGLSQESSNLQALKEGITSTEFVNTQGPRTLADMPNVVNNPKRVSQVPNTYFARGTNITISCSEENPNDFTFENGFPCSPKSPYKAANDLTVAAGENFTLTNITASIFANGSITNVAVNYYNNASGRPGTIIGSQPSATILSQTVIGSNMGLNVNEIVLSVTPFLFAGQANASTKYWIQLSVTDSGSTKNVYWVVTSSSSVGSSSAQFDGQWTIPDPVDGVYIWEGNCDLIGGGNNTACSEENPNNFTFDNGYNCSSASVYKTANDLTVATNENFTLKNITASFLANGGIANVAVKYYADSSGFPGTLIGSQASVTINSQTVIGNKFGRDANEVKMTVTPFTFLGQAGSPKKYWVELSVTNGGATNDVFWVATSTSMIGRPIAYRDGGSISSTGWVAPDLSLDGVYAWEGDCSPIGGGVIFPNPYCGPVNFPGNVEPITLVSVAGINNGSSAVLGGSPSHENFTSIEGAMELGKSYSIALEGNTAGNWENRFVVFIDWNQNGILNDPGEVYQITNTILGSTGTDGQQATGTISVPAGAMVGNTRMRVKKISGTANYLNPCLGATYGQAEDYTIKVTASHIDYVYQNGTWTPANPAGVCTSIDNIHIINGAAEFTTDITANNITVDLGATLEVEKVLTIAGNLTNNGTLLFVSSGTANGELGYVPQGSIITGNATVQRYMSNSRSYRLVTSAVTTTNSIHANWQEGATSNTHNPVPGFGTHITGTTQDQTNGFDGTSTGNVSMFTVDVAAQQFQAVTNTDVSTLTAGEPYLLFVRGDRSIDLNSNTASGETVLRATGSLYAGTHTQDFNLAVVGDFVMFGNPYQSTVNINNVFAGSTNVNTNQYYVYDPNLADQGAYVTVNLATGNNTSGSVANQYLQPGQAGQVEVLGAAPSVVFKESDKAPGNFTFSSRNPISANNLLTVQLYTTENFNNGGPVHDSFGIIFADGNDNEITPADAIKPMNFYENLGIDNNGTYLSLEYRDMPQPEEVYSLYSAGYKHSDYTLKMNVDGLEGILLFLDDNFTGTSTLLQAGENSYRFSVDAGDALSLATDRFSIRTEQRLGVEGNSLLSDIRLFPNPLNGNTFYINAPSLNGEQLMVIISDLAGRRIYEQTLECNSNTVTVPMNENLASGVYLVILKHGGQAHTYRLIKE